MRTAGSLALFVLARVALLAGLFWANSAFAGHVWYPTAPAPCVNAHGGFDGKISCPTKADADANTYWTDDYTQASNYYCGGNGISFRNEVDTPQSIADRRVYVDMKCGNDTEWRQFTNSWATWSTTCPGNSTYNTTTGYCDEPLACSTRTNTIQMPVPGPTPASICFQGCTYAVDFSSDQPGSIGAACDLLGANCHLNYTTAGAAADHALAPTDPRFNETCTDGENPGQTEGDTDGDGTPDAEDPDQTDTDGDGIPDKTDSAPNDPTNGADDGDGDEGDNVSTGGGNCQSPPVSHGDGITGQIAYQTWATRCQLELLNSKPGVNSAGGGTVVVGGGGNGDGDVAGGASCDEEYTCEAGDTSSCMALEEAHKTRCAAEKAGAVTDDIAAHGGDGGSGDEGTAGDAFETDESNPATVDAGGFLGNNRSCPNLPAVVTAFSVPGVSIQDTLCDTAGILALLVLAAMYVHAAMILGQSASGAGV